MVELLAIAAFWGLLGAAACCFRVSAWHRQESAYWHKVAWQVRIDPSQDTHYRPILNWAQANRPSLWRRIRAWQSPAIRQMDASR